MAKMHGGSVLIVVLVMLVLPHFISTAEIRRLKKPSEVFGKKDIVNGQSSDDCTHDKKLPEEMTFEEYKIYKQSMRNPPKENKIVSSPDDKSGDGGPRVKISQEERQKEAKQDGKATQEASSPTTEEGKSPTTEEGKSPTPEEGKSPTTEAESDDSNNISSKTERVESPVTPLADEDEVLSDVGSETAESRGSILVAGSPETKGFKVNTKQVQGQLLEASVPRPDSPQQAPNEVATNSDNSAGSTEKTCTGGSPVWYYYALAVVAPAACLTNIALVTWIYLGRATTNNMRIPRCLEHKSSQTSERSKIFPSHISGQDNSRRISSETSASVRALLSKPRNISPGQSVTTFDTFRKESAGLSPGPPEAYHQKNGPETRQVKKMVHEYSCGDDAHVSDISSMRSNIGNRQGQGRGQTGTASVSENSQGFRAYRREHNSCPREVPMDLAKTMQKLLEEDARPSRADRGPVSRRSNHSFGHTSDRGADKTSASLERSRRRNLDLIDDNVYIKGKTLNKAHNETQTKSLGEIEQAVPDKSKVAESEAVKGIVRDKRESCSLDVGIQKSQYFDVATQMSSTDIQKRPTSELQRQHTSVTLISSGAAETPKAAAFIDSTTSPAPPRLIANVKATGDAVISEQYGLANAKPCACGDTGTGDHYGRRVGCHERICACHPNGNTLGRPMGGTGNVDVSKPGMYEQLASAQQDAKEKGNVDVHNTGMYEKLASAQQDSKKNGNVDVHNTGMYEQLASAQHDSKEKVNVDVHKTRMYEKLVSAQQGAKGKGNVDVHNTGMYDKLANAQQDAKETDEISYKADPFIFEGESLMPPPPFGYHVRRDFSNPESSTNLCQVMQFDSAGNHLNAVDLLNTNDRFASRAVVSIDDSEDSSSSTSSGGGLWKSLVNSQLTTRDAVTAGRQQSQGRRLNTEPKKRRKKLMIIGKVAKHKRKTGKQDKKTQLEVARDYGYELFDNGNEVKRERKHGPGRLVPAYPMVVKAGKRPPRSDDKYAENTWSHANKVNTTTASFKSFDDTSKQYCSILNYVEKQSPRLHVKRNARHRSTLTINGGVNIKRVNENRESVDARKLAKRLQNAAESQSYLNMIRENNHNSPHRMLPSQRENLELLSTYYMNLNSNAGVSDQSIEGVPGGETETGAASVENVHRSHQHGSMRADTELRASCSEEHSNISPSIDKDGDDVITVVMLGTSETMVNPSRSNDQLNLGVHDPEGEGGTQQKIQAASDSGTNQKKSQEPAHSEKIVDFIGENHLSRSTASLPPRDPHIHGPHNSRTKKKIKTSETALIKQENCIPKKVSIAAANKDWRKFVNNKARQEKHKQHISNRDPHKTRAGTFEKHNKIAVEVQRFGKTGKSSEDCREIFDAFIRTTSSHVNSLDYTALKDAPAQRGVFHHGQSQGVRSVVSDHHCSPHGTASSASGKTEEGGHMKRLVSLMETMPSQGSPKKSSLSAHNNHKPNLVGNRCSIQVKTPTITRTNGSVSATPVYPKQESIPGASLKSDIVGKRDAQKRVDSSNKDTEVAIGDLPVSPRKELGNFQEKDLDTHQTPTIVKVSASDKADNVETSLVCPETTLFVESPSCIQAIDAQIDHFSRTKQSPSLKSAEIALRYRIKNNLAESGKGKNLECVTTKENHGESSNGKLCANITLTGKRKNVTRLKTHSRSPDGKRKRRNSKRSNNEAEDIKTEKSRKLKVGDKLTEKKRKKKKSKPKSVDDKEERTQTTEIIEHLVYKPRSRSNERNKLTEVVASSVPLENPDVATSEPGLSMFLDSKRKQEVRSASSTGRLASSGQTIHSFNRQQLFKFEELKMKSHTSSVESTSSASGSNMQVLSAESLLPFPASTPKAPAKAVQLLPCAKVKRNEKDLQQAELGWNSTFTNDDKGVAEKAKQNQKRAMVRYYIVKPKPKKTEKEVGVSKLKRPAPRINHPDGDAGGSGSEIDLGCEVVPPERVKPGQGKSVQFSDNIEDLEASKEEAIIDRPLRRPESDSMLHHPIVKATIDSINAASKVADPEIAASGKALPQKKEEQRSPVMMMRKRRPIWLKKSTKGKPAAAVAKPNEAVKSAAIGVSVTKLHSTDNVLKGSSRLNLHTYFPMKATVGSPKLSNTSLVDKRKVTYKAWINNIFTAAPMNKATKKIVAKAGSPVDIKEIIEGSSVDAADHFKISKPLHDGDVRAARSVPSLAPNKSSCVDLIIGKKHKFSDDSRLVSQKKSKDKPRECWSPRSHSTAESKEHLTAALKTYPGVDDGPTSPAASSNVDFVAAFKQKNGLSRTGDHGHRRRKDQKGEKKLSHDSGAKWQAFVSHENRNAPSLEHAQYCGDVVDLNVINMGLTWVVQSVFNRLPFLNQRQDSTSISTRGLVSDPQGDD
ncbi:hypothetical protein BsWGS_27739 [Bradybaena similaris]